MSKRAASIGAVCCVFLWLMGCGRHTASREKTAVLAAIGDSISLVAQQALLKEVSTALQNAGAETAIEICHVKAPLLTDSLAKAYHVFLQRVTNRPRNPGNALHTSIDSAVWQTNSAVHAGEKVLTGTVQEGEQGSYLYYRPIYIAMPACLKCHGDPNGDIEPATLEKITRLYPRDQAQRYTNGALRGLWKITFQPQ